MKTAMNNLPLDPRTPSPEQLMRADVADICFLAHSEINIAMGRAALAIVDGAPIAATLDVLDKKMDALGRMMRKAAYLKAGL